MIVIDHMDIIKSSIHSMNTSTACSPYSGERERSTFCHGYRYSLQDQDTTWPAACKSLCRGHDKKGFVYRISKYGL